ncbi:MAG TPA: hypothetical protein VK633_12860 [Verrucomicrobiae bacterium]|nr:hypothetical protein [Verrucomicrobiae bacterium]
MNLKKIYFQKGLEAGCPVDQMDNFDVAEVTLQYQQLLASAAARLCDHPNGPTEVAIGGARCGGKSHWAVAQVGADDCQRFPGLKCLIIRKVAKSNTDHFEDLRRKIFRKLPHEFTSSGKLTFENGSEINLGHFHNESDIDTHLGMEYDVIVIEEATTLTARKHMDIATCCRSTKKFPDGTPWRARIYCTMNPGGVGHQFYRNRHIIPWQNNTETITRFIPARVEHNEFASREYVQMLESLTGWKKLAWRYGYWDIAAGQFFTTFRRDIHVIDDFDDTRAVEWFAALDYGFTHYTVVLLGCKDGDGNIFVVDEHAERGWVPERHAHAIEAMLQRHGLSVSSDSQDTNPSDDESRIPICRSLVRGPSGIYFLAPISRQASGLARFVAGTDVFSRQSDGTTIAAQYSRHGINLSPANTDRVNGWAEILTLLGDPDAGIRPRLFIHKSCARLIDCLPSLQHDPNRPEDVLKIDVEEDGLGGDDTADALRYLIATKPREIYERNLTD